MRAVRWQLPLTVPGGASAGLASTAMTHDFLPVPPALPPIPEGTEPRRGAPTGNTRVGIGMFGRHEGATLTELRRACSEYVDEYKSRGNDMPQITAGLTKSKLHEKWQWKDNVNFRLQAEKTKEERGGEPVYRLNRPMGGVANKQPEVVCDPSVAQSMETSNMQATNTILYGPLATGKTFTTIDEAIRILDPEFYAKHDRERESLKARFDELVASKRIRFVTFHQSFSYEDFVEGLRAETDENEGGQIQYVIEKGVFKAICEDASRPMQDATKTLGASDSPRIWKISIDGTGESATRRYCFKYGEARIGWGHVGDLKTAQFNDSSFALGTNDKSTLELFGNEIAEGDVLLCIGSNTEVAAIGIVSGNYRYEATPPAGVLSDYKNVLPVNWIVNDSDFSILNLNGQKRFTLKTVYEITRFSWPELLEGLRAAGVDLKAVGQTEINADPFVLIIDEINRGNVSRIFGELITLIEPSKRLGAKESLTVTLPYSKKPFGVPKNIHLIGTMNTADKSLTGLDIALRRRFVFKEMPPKPELLDNVIISGLSVGQMLRAMNQRIEVLVGRDHCIGHAYFLPLDQDRSIERLSAIFKQQVMPLLLEYFFEDWERIGWVLNDHRTNGEPFIRMGEQGLTSLTSLFGSKVASELRDKRWSVNDVAFNSIGSYINIVGDSE